VQELFGDEFTESDLRLRKRQGEVRGEQAWQNNLDSLYDKLKKRGLMQQIRMGAPWTLTDEGTEMAALWHAILRPGPRRPIAEGPLLADFKPGSAFEYRAHLAGREIVKRREHESVLRSFGEMVAAKGWRPSTKVYPRDLELLRGDDTWLAEVKVVYNGNATHATRDALAQLVEYRHFFYPEESPRLLAVFSEDIGAAMRELLLTLGIESVWRDDATWRGTPAAISAGLTSGS
jgi:hypothetical protein